MKTPATLIISCAILFCSLGKAEKWVIGEYALMNILPLPNETLITPPVRWVTFVFSEVKFHCTAYRIDGDVADIITDDGRNLGRLSADLRTSILNLPFLVNQPGALAGQPTFCVDLSNFSSAFNHIGEKIVPDLRNLCWNWAQSFSPRSYLSTRSEQYANKVERVEVQGSEAIDPEMVGELASLLVGNPCDAPLEWPLPAAIAPAARAAAPGVAPLPVGPLILDGASPVLFPSAMSFY